MKRIAVVLWSGEYGGAETWSVILAKSLVSQGAAVGVVLVGGQGPLCARLADKNIQYRCLGLRRGRAILSHFVRFASTVRELGSDAAILPSGGYMSAALRLGGYGGGIVAVEHGTLLQLPYMGRLRRLLRVIDALSGAWAVDAQVVPSEFMLRLIQRKSYGVKAKRIYLGTECEVTQRTRETTSLPAPEELNIGFAGRLVRGKGLDVLLEAMARVRSPLRVHLNVAGDGPERSAMETSAARMGIADRVQFHGWVSDIGAFWSACHLAVVPSREDESFGMVAVEAMAAGLPVLAARSGGLAEVVLDGETGALFESGDSGALAQLIEAYAKDPLLREQQGAHARDRVRSQFNIDRCAAEFLGLVQDLTRPHQPALAGGT